MPGRILLVLLILLAIPWAIRTWWRMRLAHGPKERAFIARSSLAGWMFLALVAVALMILKGQALLFALPVFGVAGMALQHGWKKTLTRIQTEESDPLSRARKIN